MIEFIKKLICRKPQQLRCLKCKHFTWWDGDYCCFQQMQILCPSKDGHISKQDYNKLRNKYLFCRNYKRSKQNMIEESKIVNDN